jgi:hypothetical protein
LVPAAPKIVAMDTYKNEVNCDGTKHYCRCKYGKWVEFETLHISTLKACLEKELDVLTFSSR